MLTVEERKRRRAVRGLFVSHVIGEPVASDTPGDMACSGQGSTNEGTLPGKLDRPKGERRPGEGLPESVSGGEEST